MKLFKTLMAVVLLAALLSACGAEPVPTITAGDVALTAQAAAQTMVAQTLAAVPSATPLPPTDIPTATPLVTDTPLVPPTLEVLASPTLAAPTTDPNVDPCQTRQLKPSKGKPTRIQFANKTKYPVRVSLYLEETPAHGECGYRSFDIAKNNATTYDDLVQGCYYVYAWSLDSKKAFQVNGGGCINNPDKWIFEISEKNVKFVGP